MGTKRAALIRGIGKNGSTSVDDNDNGGVFFISLNRIENRYVLKLGT